ncbi:MAG: PD-(D/E)XK nuclease family protein [Candidatus Roizmanbacteria bacterium]|nr:PD-(D/E)XK nuclease family protein [Candidatus Roizmanbacteria bacterium]
MTPDKYSAVWVSHTSINDFLQCPRAYYLKHVYKDPKTGHKIKVMTPPLALGQAVHEVIEQMSTLPTQDRFKKIPMARYEEVWKKISGKLGGFLNDNVEDSYKRRGREMISMITKHPGPIAEKAVKIHESLPHYWLSEDANIILCGKVDWLQYLPETDSIHIIDFKTGKSNESDSSLQLPIYLLLVSNTQKRTVSKVSYWYIARQEDLEEQKLPNEKDAYEKVLDVARRIKTARQLEQFSCPDGGCRACAPMERVLNGEGEFVGLDEYRTDIYVLPTKEVDEESQSTIL